MMGDSVTESLILARVYQPEMQKLHRGRSWSGNERLQDV